MDIEYPYSEARRAMVKKNMSIADATLINSMLENIANRYGWNGLAEFTKQCGDYYVASQKALDVLGRWRADLAELHRAKSIPQKLSERYEISVVEDGEKTRWYIAQNGGTIGIVTKTKGEK